MKKTSTNYPLVVLISVLTALASSYGLFLVLVNFNNLPSSQVESQNIYSEESQMIDSIENVKESVVSIVASKDVPVFNSDLKKMDFKYQKVSGGSGFIVSEDGLVLTNKHVIKDARADYVAITNNGKKYPVEIVDQDQFEDVAVVKIIGDKDMKFEVSVFGNSDSLKIGQRVIAIGNALAEYENSVTSGIVSALGRNLSAFYDIGDEAENFYGLIQTDAAINYGNSGGPLLNLDGEIIGMNVAIEDSAYKIGFAIPINDLKSIIQSVLDNGKIIRPVLGVRFVMLTEEQAKDINPDLSYGALLVGDRIKGQNTIMPNSSADNAGLKKYDIILQVDSQIVDSDHPLHRIISKYKPNDQISLKVWRDGVVIDVSVVLKSNK
jgi:serine protease Do